MEIQSVLAELRTGNLEACAPDELASELATMLSGDDDELAERAALAAYYAAMLPAPVGVPALETLLLDPAAERREVMRGRLWWIILNRAAADSSIALETVCQTAADILAAEQSAVARLRVFAFLKAWPLRAAIFPYLGNKTLSSLEHKDDGRVFDQLKKEALLAARQAAGQGQLVANAARQAVRGWQAGELKLDDALAIITAAEPLLEDFPLADIDLDQLSGQASRQSANRPRLRELVRLYGAWLWARFGETDEQQPLGDGLKHAARELPASWERLLAALEAYRAIDPWCEASLLKLEAMLARNITITSGTTVRPEPELALAFVRALAAPAMAQYSSPACEQSYTEILKPALCMLAKQGKLELEAAQSEALDTALRNGSSYRAEAAASALRFLSMHSARLGPLVGSMSAALCAQPNDTGGMSPGTEVGKGDLAQKAGCDSAKAYDDIDLPPADTESGFMNLDGLTALLGMCLPATTAHRLALALRDALASGQLDAENAASARDALIQAAKADNSVAKAWLQAQT